MITDIHVEPIDKYPYHSVVLNGEKLKHVNDGNSPTGVSGKIRYVFVSEDYVVKIGSIGESKVDIALEDKAFFAETVLVDIEAHWLVQKRIKCVPNAGASEADWQQILGIIQKYDIGDVCFRYDEDFSEGTKVCHNWIVDINGQPVIFDYDYNVHTSNGFASWQFLSRDCDCTDCRNTWM